MNEHGQTICLNMIVKDEAPVIRRCLDSLRPLIDTWVIVDTGSTDGTQDTIREHLRDLPGELFERPWVNFAHNRSEALSLARGRADYVLVIDADEAVELEAGFRLPRLASDSYDVEMFYGGFTYLRKQLVRDALPWKYTGVMHEYIHCEEARTQAVLTGIRTVPRHDGARARQPHTYRRDALLLENALLEDPSNTRNVFYLAQSYRDAGDIDLALRHYRHRVEMGGWREEIWVSLYQIAQLKERHGKPWAEVMEDYFAAYQFMPDRAGPLYRLGMHYQAKGEFYSSHLFFARAMQIPAPTIDRLFVEREMYDHRLPIEYGVACFYVGDHSAAIETNNRLLRQPSLPAALIEHIIKNRRFSIDALFPPTADGAGEPGPLILCVPFRDPGAEIDDLVESLIRQESPEWQAFFIDDGSRTDPSHHLPLEDSRFSLIQNSTPRGWDRCVEHFVAQRGATQDIVLALTLGDRLEGRNALEQIRTAFKHPDCHLLYGQHRLPSGKLGDAEPAPNETLFNENLGVLAKSSPIAFRTALLRGLRPTKPPATQPVDNATPLAGRMKSPLIENLFRTAGFHQTRFTDAVLTLVVEPKPTRPPTPSIYGTGPSHTGHPLPTKLPPTLASLETLPLISCLMVTYDRLALAKRSIECFASQTYPRRELVIVTNGAPRFLQSLERFVAQLGLTNVRFHHLENGDLSLGQLRNASLDAARGEIICQWDDDDCNHPERMVIQAEHMLKEKARACFMTDHLHFLEDLRAVVWVDWTLGGRTRVEQLLPGTVMMFKDDRFRYPETGDYARQGEDSMFLYSIYDTVPVASLVGMGHLYLYTFHGRNTFSKEHHHQMSSCSVTVSEMKEREETIRRALMHYPIARPVVVAGRDGPAFALND